MTDVEIEIRGETLALMSERAVWWKRADTLLVADPHFGKAATFRASGIPVPSGTTHEALTRLRGATGRTRASRVIFLGDLLHAKAGRSAEMLEALEAWRRANADLDLVLVRGNHDRHAGDPPAGLGMTCVDAPFRCGPFELCHHPVHSATGYVIAGHVHPGVRLYGAAGLRARLPCFVIGRSSALLPAFGDFTGLAEVEPEEGQRIFAVAESEIVGIVSDRD